MSENNFYRLAGIGLVISIGFVLVDIGLSFAGGDLATGSTDAAGWFAHFHDNWFVGLRNLGLFNVINNILILPVYLVLYRLHRRQAPELAMLALSLFLLGISIYAANNRALAMLALSQQYAAAGAAQKELFEAAGAAILVQAEDFTPGSFLGMFLSSAASLMVFAMMLRGQVFRRWLSILGLIGVGCLLIFTIILTFIPVLFQTAMPLALVGGLCMLAWNIVMAANMFRMGQAQRSVAGLALSSAG